MVETHKYGERLTAAILFFTRTNEEDL